MEAPTQNGNFYHNKFYSAIMDQDDGRITDLAERHGVNVYIKVKDEVPERIFNKVIFKKKATEKM